MSKIIYNDTLDYRRDTRSVKKMEEDLQVGHARESEFVNQLKRDFPHLKIVCISQNEVNEDSDVKLFTQSGPLYIEFQTCRSFYRGYGDGKQWFHIKAHKVRWDVEGFICQHFPNNGMFMLPFSLFHQMKKVACRPFGDKLGYKISVDILTPDRTYEAWKKSVNNFKID
jgi:hypothetical protein